MSQVKAEIHVASRNRLGQFIREVETAGALTAADMIDEGAKLSRALAPVGTKTDLRTIPLKESIYTQMRSRTSGFWGSSARHALPIEKGARPHFITGNPVFARFFWEEMGRFWIPGLFGEPDIVSHPGNEAQPFLKPALDIVMSKWRQIARRRYPNGR